MDPQWNVQTVLTGIVLAVVIGQATWFYNKIEDLSMVPGEINLIKYQIGELRTAISDHVDGMEGEIKNHERRIDSLEQHQ